MQGIVMPAVPVTTNIFSELAYLYRDASNYKFTGTFYVSGSVERCDFEPYLFDCEFFIPEVIGIRPVRPTELGEDDHFLHTIEDIALIEQSATSHLKAAMSSAEFVARMRAASLRGWFESIEWEDDWMPRPRIKNDFSRTAPSPRPISVTRAQ